LSGLIILIGVSFIIALIGNERFDRQIFYGDFDFLFCHLILARFGGGLSPPLP